MVDFTKPLYPQGAATGGQTIAQHCFRIVLGALATFSRSEYVDANVQLALSITAELEAQLNSPYVPAAPYFAQPPVVSDPGIDMRTFMATYYVGTILVLSVFPDDIAFVVKRAIEYADAYLNNAP